MPRTHRQKLLSFHHEQVTGTRYLELDAEHLGKEKEPLPLPVRKGDVILFNDRCIHCSTPNRSDHGAGRRCPGSNEQIAPGTIQAARDYGVSIGIHPEQLCFERFMGNPFDQ